MNFKLTGTVKKFSGNGRKLGYPTANIEIDPNTQEGLFVGYTTLQNQKLPSIIFIGAPQTFNESHKRAESYILNFPDKDLYGEHIEIEILKKLRVNKKFPSAAALVAQMQKDEQAAGKYFQAQA